MAINSLAEPITVDQTARCVSLSYDDFLNSSWGNSHVEWVEGKVVPMSPISREHSDVGLFLIRLLSQFVEGHQLGVVMYDPFQMKTGPELAGRAPDILFLANAHLDRLHANHLEGPADLVVEIISPASRAVDRGEKFYEYEQGGVPEYWLIDPHRKQAEFYQRSDDGIYHPIPADHQGIYRSRTLPGLWLKVAWLWQAPLPPLLDILREWQVI
jgi:Uma2 family endonuclease